MPEFLLKSYSEILNNFRITGKLQKLLFKLSSKIDLTFFRAYFNTEAVVQSCSVEKVILEISQNSQENTCAKVSFLTELQASGLHVNTICSLFMMLVSYLATMYLFLFLHFNIHAFFLFSRCFLGK